MFIRHANPMQLVTIQRAFYKFFMSQTYVIETSVYYSVISHLSHVCLLSAVLMLNVQGLLAFQSFVNVFCIASVRFHFSFLVR